MRRRVLSWFVHAVTRPFARAIILSACRAPAPSRTLVDAESITGGACPEFPQGMPVALAPGREREQIAPALAEEGDDAAGELAERHRVERRGVEPVDDERAVAADPFETFARSLLPPPPGPD